jgi:hypothetical protein
MKKISLFLVFLPVAQAASADWLSWITDFSPRENKLAVVGTSVIVGGLVIDKIIDKYGKSKHADAVEQCATMQTELNKKTQFSKEEWRKLKASNISYAHQGTVFNRWGGFTPLYDGAPVWKHEKDEVPTKSAIPNSYKFWWKNERGTKVQEQWFINKRNGDGSREMTRTRTIPPYEHSPVIKASSILLGGALIGINWWSKK